MECRCCGHDREEVDERVKRLGTFYDLCDACACVGKICSASNPVLVGELSVSEFVHMMRTLLRKSKEEET